MQNSKLQFKVQNFLNPTLIILFAVLLRLIPHPPNFAPIGALALFGGVYINNKYALFIPLLAMVISDIFLGFHNTIFFVYGSFLLTGLIGLQLRNHKSVYNILLGALSSSLLFFIITNFGVWMVGSLYPKTVHGIITCYTLALPFLRNTVFGDLFYTGLFFGSFELLRSFVWERKRIQS